MEGVTFTDYMLVHSYGQDVLADFSGPCLSAITEKWDALSALFQVHHNSVNEISLVFDSTISNNPNDTWNCLIMIWKLLEEWKI